MTDRERFESHAANLGKLVGNLQSLEMGARMVIVKLDPRCAAQVRTQLPQVRRGDVVEPNAFTNNDDLNQTLEKYNKCVSLDCRIDIKPIVNLRDALAHGRTFGYGQMKHLRLLKFSRKRDSAGSIVVELAEDMTNDWFSNHIQALEAAFEKVRVALDYEKREFV